MAILRCAGNSTEMKTFSCVCQLGASESSDYMTLTILLYFTYLLDYNVGYICYQLFESAVSSYAVKQLSSS